MKSKTDRWAFHVHNTVSPYLSTAAEAIGIGVNGRVGTAAGATQDEVFLINGIVAHVCTHGCCCRSR